MSLVGRETTLHHRFGPYILQTTISDELYDILLKVAYKIRKNKKLKKENDYRKHLAGNLSEEYSYDNAFNKREDFIVNEELTWLASYYTKCAKQNIQRDFDREPKDIANGVLDLISIANNTNSGEGTWHDEKKSEVVILVPPILGKLSTNESWINYKEWIGAFEKSKKLNEFYKDMCKEKKIEFVDTNEFIVSSENDPIHWSKSTHKDFGAILAKIFSKKIKP